jgi:hypothetical protein
MTLIRESLSPRTLKCRLRRICSHRTGRARTLAPPALPGVGTRLTAFVAQHTRDVGDTLARAAAIRNAARGWAGFWDGHLDLDALAVDVTEHLADLREARARVERFTAHSRQWWEHLWGNDPLVLSLPGVGPATVRAFAPSSVTPPASTAPRRRPTM